MPWQLVMLFQNLLSAVFAINSRVIARRFHRATMPLNIIMYALISLSGLVYACSKGLHSIVFSIFIHYLGLFLFAGLCFAVTNMLSYMVFQYVDAAIASLLASFNVVVAVIFSTLLIHESLTIRQLVGGLILLGAMQLILTLKLSKYRHKKLGRAITISILASIFYGLAVATEKYLLNRVNLSTYLTFGWGFQFVGVVVVSLVLGRSTKANFGLLKSKRFWQFALPAGLIRMFAGLLYIFSLKLANNLSLVSALTGLKIILTALLATYFLKEVHFIRRKLEAAFLAAFGIAVMLWK
jgi:drug/metabolite transporter (DMT)-like permease